MSLPFGAVDPNTMIEGNDWAVPALGISALLSNVFIANSPQLILSMIYFTYNSLFTSFMLGAEWNSFASRRKGLRVSGKPIGDQNGTHFLQLPFRWAIPLMTLSTVLHWLCSQSIFLVSTEFDHSLFIEMYNDGSSSCQSPDANIEATWGQCLVQYFTCGYSPVAILCTIILSILMIIFALLVGLRTYGNGSMPVAGSCSAAISASCHLKDEGGKEGMGEDEIGERASCSMLQWGEFDAMLIPNLDLDDESEGNSMIRDGLASQRRVYQCGFSHREVNVPEAGKLYAG